MTPLPGRLWGSINKCSLFPASSALCELKKKRRRVIFILSGWVFYTPLQNHCGCWQPWMGHMCFPFPEVILQLELQLTDILIWNLEIFALLPPKCHQNFLCALKKHFITHAKQQLNSTFLSYLSHSHSYHLYITCFQQVAQIWKQCEGGTCTQILTRQTCHTMHLMLTNYQKIQSQYTSLKNYQWFISPIRWLTLLCFCGWFLNQYSHKGTRGGWDSEMPVPSWKGIPGSQILECPPASLIPICFKNQAVLGKKNSWRQGPFRYSVCLCHFGKAFPQSQVYLLHKVCSPLARKALTTGAFQVFSHFGSQGRNSSLRCATPPPDKHPGSTPRNPWSSHLLCSCSYTHQYFCLQKLREGYFNQILTPRALFLYNAFIHKIAI